MNYLTMKKFWVVLVSISVIGLGLFYITFNNLSKYHILQGASISQTKTYTNTKFKYALTYPSTMMVTYVGGPINIPDSELSAVIIGKPPTLDNSRISTHEEEDIAGVTAITPNAENAKFISLPLAAFTQAVRQVQVEEKAKNTGLANQIIGDINPTSVAGQEAYSFRQSSGFNSPDGSSYIFANPKEVYAFVFIENKAGQKVMLHYIVGNSDAESIIKSFHFLSR